MDNKKAEMERLLEDLFKHQLQMKMYHFQTRHYGAHKTVDKYLDKFRANLDMFMEVAQGIYGKVSQKSINLSVETATDENIEDELNKFILRLMKLTAIFTNNSDLLNIKDEMIAELKDLSWDEAKELIDAVK